MQLVDLKRFAVVAAIFDPATGGARPLFDSAFWFPEIVVGPPAWLLVYTGRGTPKEDTLSSGERVLTFFWHRQETMFDGRVLVPLLVRIDAALVGRASL
jgi:hypothetical protein